jgi:fructose-bisphosphate aldolase class II
MTRSDVTLPIMLAAARAGGYAVPAINVIDVATMDGVLRAASECRSPVIVQTAAVTARTWGPATLAAAFRALTERTRTTAVLQLDHCSDRKLVDACLDAGWDAVLFDGAALAPERNLRETRDLVARAHSIRAAVEGELESFGGSEPGASSGRPPAASLETNLRFIEGTGIDCFAPSIGNVHGRTNEPVVLDVDRIRQLVESTSVPLALHGGTGIPDVTMRKLIEAGCSKVNVSTAIREACAAALCGQTGPAAGRDDPLASLVAICDAARTVSLDVMARLGSAGRADPPEA